MGSRTKGLNMAVSSCTVVRLDFFFCGEQFAVHSVQHILAESPSLFL